MKRKKGNQTTVAIDIGSHYLKLGVSESNGNLSAFELSRRPAEPNEMASLLSEWVAKHRLEKKPAFSSISGPEINTQYLPIPPLTGKELSAAIKIEAEQILGEDISQMDFDFSLLNREKGTGNVLFVAAPQIITEARVALLQSVGLTPAGLTLDSIALANAYLASGNNGSETTLLLNIGHRTSNLAVIENNDILFIRDILWGNEKVVTEIVSTTNFDVPTVLDIMEKRKYSEITSSYITDNTSLTILLEELEKTIVYCHQTLGARVKNLIIVGGGSQLPSLPEFLAERLRLQLKPWAVLEGLDLQPEQKESLGPFCAILVGLVAGK